MIRSKQSVLLCATAALLFSCAKEKDELYSGVILKNMDPLVKPGDNFHAYVNGAWIKNTPIPDDKSSYGVGEIAHDKAQEDVKQIIEESAKGTFKDGSNEQKIGDFYNAY